MKLHCEERAYASSIECPAVNATPPCGRRRLWQSSVLWWASTFQREDCNVVRADSHSVGRDHAHSSQNGFDFILS